MSMLGPIGTIMQGNAARAAGNREASIADRNRTLANQDRIRNIRASEIAADKRRENRRQLSSIRAAYGASGIEMAGSPLDVLMDTSTEMATDVRRVEQEGQVVNRSGALAMLGLNEDANTARATGLNARNAAVIKAGAQVGEQIEKAVAAGAGGGA